jgi:hypothetical protein
MKLPYSYHRWIFSAAINEYIEKLSEADMIQAIIKYIRQMTRNLSFDTARAYINEAQAQLDEYKTDLVELWIRIRDRLIDYAAAVGLGRMVEPFIERVGPINVQQKFEQFIAYVRGRMSTTDMAERAYTNYMPKITVKLWIYGKYMNIFVEK